MSKEIVYNSEELTVLSNNYANLLSEFDNIITEHNKVFEGLNEVYEGQAKPILEEIGTPIQKHLEALKICYECCQKSLENANFIMQSVDENVAISLEE